MFKIFDFEIPNGELMLENCFPKCIVTYISCYAI